MRPIDLSSLVRRLSDLSRRQLESAAGMALSRTQYDVEAEHWLLFLLREKQSDFACIVDALDIDPAVLEVRLEKAINSLKTGNGRTPSLSPEIVRLMKTAWLAASVERGAATIRSVDLLVALATDTENGSGLRRTLAPVMEALARCSEADLLGFCQNSEEAAAATSARDVEEESGTDSAPRDRRFGAALTRYAQDLVALAEAGKIDPILGRDVEIRQVADILLRRRQNNPILVGEAGVGKTAVVEGLALRLAAGDVPPALKNARIFTLDLGLLQAGAGVKGEFENRLKDVIADVDAAPVPVILFIDEAHTLIGAGGGGGSADAANLLKPVLARGSLRVVAATTWAEYKKYFEKDAALTRRFQPVNVGEPDIPTATAMLRGLADTLRRHHGVLIMEDAVEAAVSLSARYVAGRQLPDKAVSLLDTACARVAMSQNAVPALLEDAERRMAVLDTEIKAVEQEAVFGNAEHKGRLETLNTERRTVENRKAALEDKAGQERELVGALEDLWGRIATADGVEKATLEEEYRTVFARLKDVQGEQPMIFPMVDQAAVAAVVSDWTGIPLGRMKSDQLDTVLNLEKIMQQRIIGQDHALRAIAKAVQTSRAGLNDPRKPVGVFLMVGTSGVGKTETALALADLLYGGEQSLTVINMSEFKEEHKVSLLMGSPPGYIGYGEGGILTEAVRRKPYSVLLLDEMEKAHPGVQEVFFQVFDKGHMKDGEGRDIDFRNTLIVMTSNAGTDLIASLYADEETAPPQETIDGLVYEDLLKSFKPAFLGRTKVVTYVPLGRETLLRIVDLQLKRVQERVKKQFGVTLDITEAVRTMLVERCEEGSAGARALESVISNALLPEISKILLKDMIMEEEKNIKKNKDLSIDLCEGSLLVTKKH
ncbi:type VI secretion system ATPase TssH [Acetobacter sp.]|jgi:type VI secretion system protein VasG|uniref:type VI secretion system ATPase TssH n=1 Tax=Acetobacter sp. TaxID=440 RepID=UPI0025C1571B|nr:type VI secretion system ATPase TssH [Acetobacter sp.]MCH4092633.1 type VI secretion system ATPase TssH [Acetobacter sp.]MCI1299767.1 type VI secretion system ATPase TssH [Acetobacter sp.]MCI1315353.1 type VI secretion system ATPase TssH [Acetobacter sp.]